MGIKTPGSLGGLQYLQESAYGTTPTGVDFGYFGFMNSMQETGNGNEEEQIADGSRIFGSVLHRMRSAGFDATVSLFRDQGTWTWKDLIAFAYSPTQDLRSFSALMKIDYNEYVMFTGCKVDQLVLSAESVGSKVLAKVSAKALEHLTHQSSKAGFGSSLGNENTGPSPKIPIIYDAYPQMTVEGTTSQIWAKSFSISIGNALEEKEGIVSGKALAAGNGLVPGLCNVELEYTLLSKNADWDNLKLAGTDGITIVQTIGAHTLTFSNCYIVTDDHPSRTQSSYDETVRFKAGSMTVV